MSELKQSAFEALSPLETPVRDAVTVANLLDDELDKYAKAAGPNVDCAAVYYLMGRLVREIEKIDKVLEDGFKLVQRQEPTTAPVTHVPGAG